MYQLLSLVLVSLAVITPRPMVMAGELCQQNNSVTHNVCTYISTCVRSNTFLLNQVRSGQRVVEEALFRFREPVNVTSIEDLYVELITYEDTLRSLESSMKDYMTTPQFERDSLLVSEVMAANNFRLGLSRSLTNLANTRGYLSEIVTLTRQPVAPTISPTAAAKNKEMIYAETFYVTNKMADLLQDWVQKCRTCDVSRRRRAVKAA